MSNERERRVPKIWMEFEETRNSDGKTVKFWFQQIEKKHVEKILELLLSGYVKEEPLAKYLKANEEELTLSEAMEFYKHVMVLGYSIVCLTKTSDGNNEIVGFSINTIDAKDGPKIEASGIAFNKILNAVKCIHNINSIYDITGVSKFLCDKGLYVLQEYRGFGICAKYLKCWKLIAKENNVKVVGGTFTSRFSQIAATKAGFEESASRPYAELRKTHPEIFPNRIEEHTENLKVFYSEV